MKTILFLRGNRPVFRRIYKIAKALKNTKKYKLICICQNFDEDLFEGIFDEVYIYSNRNKKTIKFFKKFYTITNNIFKYDNLRVKKLLNKLKPDVIHCMAEPYDIIEYVMKKTNYPIILDAVDFTGISQGLENLSDEIVKMEKYCFEHANGICHKGSAYEINYYRNHGYKIDCPEIQFMDYCDEDFFINRELTSHTNKDINLVYVGAVSLTHVYNNYLELFEKVKDEIIHFHIYSNPWQHKMYKEYLSANRKEFCFHFHKPLPLKELGQEISQYDWGLWIHPVWNENNQSRATLDKQKVAIGNKLFSYLEAGLPIIVSDHLEYGKQIIEKYNIGFAIKDEDLHMLRKKIEQSDYNKLKHNVLVARKELSLKNKVRELEKFYENVIEYKTATR